MQGGCTNADTPGFTLPIVPYRAAPAAVQEKR
jgi:hypothetical protein